MIQALTTISKKILKLIEMSHKSSCYCDCEILDLNEHVLCDHAHTKNISSRTKTRCIRKTD